jgi:hypothetical protein
MTHVHYPDSDAGTTGWRLVPPPRREIVEPAGWQLRGAVCGECGEDLVRAVFVGSHGLANRASAMGHDREPEPCVAPR